MILRKTIFWHADIGVVTVRVYTHSELQGAGFWIWDAGTVVLSPALYDHMPNSGDQAELKKFISKLQRVTLGQIPEPLRLELPKKGLA